MSAVLAAYRSQLTDDQELKKLALCTLGPCCSDEVLKSALCVSKAAGVCSALVSCKYDMCTKTTHCRDVQSCAEMCRAVEDAQNHVHNILGQLWLLHIYVSHDAVPLQLVC